MRFNAGYFGACAVVLALLGTVLAGFVLSVDKETVPYTNYEYVTDVSGLFSYDETPATVDYNPSTNYVGYTGISNATPEYTQTSTANNYRYVVNAGETWTDSYSFDQTKQFAYDYAISHGWTNYNSDINVGSKFIKWTGSSYTVPDYIQYNGVQYQGLINIVNNGYNPQYINVTSLQTVLTDMTSTQAGFASLEINITQTGTYPVFFYNGNWVDVGGITPRSQTSEEAFNDSNVLPTKLVVDGATLNVKAYRNDVLIWENTANNIAVISHYRVSGSGYNDGSAGVTFDATYTGLPVYAYMNPNAGVTIAGGNPDSGRISWTNGYENHKITLKAVSTSTAELTVTPYDTNNNSFIGIKLYWVGQHAYVRYYMAGVYETQDIGQWPALQLTIDADAREYRVTPTWDVSLLTVVDEQPYTAVYSIRGAIDNIGRLIFERGAVSAPHWQITNTAVFLNTYNTVMNNPTIDIKDYFPDLDEYRLNFYSFALMGTGFNINGTNFDVDRDNATVTFTYGLETVTQKLKNIYVSTDDEHTYLTFADINKRYDLGETTTDTISFTGYWYFSTGLYEAVDGVTNQYVWDLDGAFHANAGQCLIIFFAILGGFVIIGHVYGRVNVKALDWVIIAFAGFMAYVYFGGLIV